MTDVAITVNGLGKRYQLGAAAGPSYKTFRDALAQTTTGWFRRHRSALKREPFWALRDVSFEVKRGEVVGVIGRNGAGKSTLLKILSRITEPTTGAVDIHGRVGSLLEVGTGFHPELTGRENIYLNGAILGMRRAEIARQFDAIVAFAEIEKFIDTTVKYYSSGMYMRLAFAVAAHLDPEILIVDEVLAVGDAEFQKKCIGRMGEVAKGGRTVLFVSHNMAAIERLCTTAIFLDDGRVRMTGSIRGAVELYLSSGLVNEVVFRDRSLVRASVTLVGQAIEISAHYNVERPLHCPCLGFVISDLLGNAICGSNPLVDGVELPRLPTAAGVVRVLVREPTLLNGTYRVSLWFGNGKQELFEERDCLTFDVVNMAPLNQLPATTVGPVFPKCDWAFFPSE